MQSLVALGPVIHEWIFKQTFHAKQKLKKGIIQIYIFTQVRQRKKINT